MIFRNIFERIPCPLFFEKTVSHWPVRSEIFFYIFSKKRCYTSMQYNIYLSSGTIKIVGSNLVVGFFFFFTHICWSKQVGKFSLPAKKLYFIRHWVLVTLLVINLTSYSITKTHENGCKYSLSESTDMLSFTRLLTFLVIWHLFILLSLTSPWD